MGWTWVHPGLPHEVEAWGGHEFTQAFPMRWRYWVNMGSPRPSHEVEAWGGHVFAQAFPMRWRHGVDMGSPRPSP